MKVDTISSSSLTWRRSMRMSYTIVLSISLLASITGRSLAAVVPKDPLFGIPPQVENYYKTSSDTIKCKDGSGKFTKAQLNDDFCDCPDGTDEPGTSACPGGQFYCRNTGHTPVFLFSSRVNDGICDCCDGSDEYDGQVQCPNTCWEAGKVARDRLQKKIATYKEGVTLRRKEIEQAKIAIAKEEAELSKLKNEEKILDGLVQQLKERKEQIEKAEEKERLQKEKEEKERKEAEEKANSEKSVVEEEAKQEKGQTEEKIGHEDKHVESTNHDVIGITDDSPADQKGQEDEESTTPKIKDESEGVSKAHHDAGTEGSVEAIDTEELSREELGRLVASRWTGNSEKQTEENGDTKDNEHEDDEKITHSTHDDEYDHYASETDDDSGKYDDINVEDDVDETYEEDAHHDDETYEEDVHHDASTSDTSDSDDEVEFSWLDKIQQTVRNILQAVNFFQTPVDKSEAARVRKEYDESSAKLSKMQSRISSLTQKLKHDFGTEKEFYSFYDRCFESKQNKYVYKVCPFKQASQVEGHSTTRLGRWDKFEDSYQVMIFSSGDKCWNGPDRSLKVKLRCGLKNEVADVDEPSRCEYVALLSTPALCLEEKLKELEDKLALMNKEQPQSHDEL